MGKEVAIIGAGPAGCAAALELARAGASVTLYEKAVFPREKLCGEFLSPEIAATLETLGCAELLAAAGAARIERAVIHTPSGTRLELPLPTPAWGLSRARLDYLLLEAARASGARLMDKVEIASATAGELLARDGRRFPSALTILAAGRHSLLQPLATGRKSWFGFKAHYEGEQRPEVELYFFRGGYCGLAPVEGGLVNLCALVERRLLAEGADAAAGPDAAERVLDSVPALRARLNGLRRVQPFLYTGPVSMGWRRPPPGVLPAGDAAMFVDPFTGGGIALALETGRLAAQHALSPGVSPEALAEYRGRLKRRFGRQLRASALLRAAPALARLEPLVLPLLKSKLFLKAAFRATRVRKSEE